MLAKMFCAEPRKSRAHMPSNTIAFFDNLARTIDTDYISQAPYAKQSREFGLPSSDEIS